MVTRDRAGDAGAAVGDSRGCRNSGMPLGGIGSGSFEIRPNGHFYNWFLMNNRPWAAGPETSAMEAYGLRFAMVCDAGDGIHCFALEENLGRDPAPDGWFWMSDAYHLPWIRHARRIAYRARIPFARLRYALDASPVHVSLLAWSPFIPHQAADSNTPGAVLTFTLQNRCDRPVKAGLLGLLKNAVGYDVPDAVSRMAFSADGPALLCMTRDGLPADWTTAGTMALAAFGDALTDVSWAAHPYPGRCVWDPLAQSGRLENTDFARDTGAVGDQGAENRASSPRGPQRGALCAHVSLAPGACTDVTFLVTWHFPNFRELERKGRTAAVIGHQYARRFASAADVARWLHRDHRRLLDQTRRFAAAFGRSSLPAWMLDAVSASWSVLLRACWWDASGRFAVWEGLGCCGLQTVDVGHYASFPILQFFPELDAGQNRLSLSNTEADGKIPHLMPGHFGCHDGDGGRGRIDLGPQFVLAVWRHALWTGNLDTAREAWPAIERNMDLMAAYDTNNDGLPDNQGRDQTYDQFPMFGTSSYVGFLYLAALHAAAGLAGRLGLGTKRDELLTTAERTAAALHRQLWNGEYFNLSHDAVTGESNSGCLADQLNGDWFYRQCLGRGLLDDAAAASALRSVYRLNRRVRGAAAWLANCVWPQGGGVQIRRRTSDQANSPWSGVEYAVAAHLILLGLRNEGRQVAADVFRRYEDAGLRFQHTECGEFYYRCMSAWAVYLAEFGFAYDAHEGVLSLAPPDCDGSSWLVVLPSGYGRATWRASARQVVLRVLGGTMDVRRLLVAGKSVPGAQSPLTAGHRAVFAC